MSEDLFFLDRNGCIWACWLSGKPAVNLGSAHDVREAMRQFVGDPAGEEEGSHPPAAPPPPPPPPREIAERVEPRHDITIFGRIYTVAGSREVIVLDLSERGCRFNDVSGTVKPNTRLTIKLGPVGPIEAEVRWRKGDEVGVAFKSPLYPSVMAHIRDSFDLRR